MAIHTGENGLRSGFGGAAMNAGKPLVQTLNTAHAQDGRLAEPLPQGDAAPAADDASRSELPMGRGDPADQGARPGESV